jgi:hypothetical protein
MPDSILSKPDSSVVVRPHVRRARGTAKRADILAKEGQGAKWPRKVKRYKRPSKVERAIVKAVAEQVAATPHSVYSTLKLTHIQSALTDALERAGLSPDRMAGLLADAVGAVKTIVGGSRLAPVVVEVPDHPVRLSAYDRVVAAQGLVPRTADLPEAPPPSVNIIFERAGGGDGVAFSPDGSQAVIPQEHVTIIIEHAKPPKPPELAQDGTS